MATTCRYETLFIHISCMLGTEPRALIFDGSGCVMLMEAHYTKKNINI